MTTLVLLLSLVIPSQAQSKPAPTLTGKWTVTLDMPGQTATPTLEITQDGEKLSGFYVSQRYGKAPLTGTLKGKAVKFTVTLNVEGTEVNIVFVGETSADLTAMKGDATLGEAGEASWTAKKTDK